MPRTDIRPLAASDPLPIARAFAEVGWPGKTVGQYRRYLDETFAGYLTAGASPSAEAPCHPATPYASTTTSY